jgi:GntR family transcriptional regulator
VPIYRQIIDQIRYQIATGALKEGDQVPSVRQLADKLAVNQNTILKVYNQLCTEKVLRVERGSGTFVAASRQSIPVAERKKIVAKLLRDAAVQAINLDVGLEQIKEQLEKEYEAIKLLWKQERSER